MIFVKEGLDAIVIRRYSAIINEYRSVPPVDVRSIVNLPLISVVIAVVGGVGVNLATGGGDASLGVQIIVAGLALAAYLGFVMAINPLKVDDTDRQMLTYLYQVGRVLHDPFIPLEQIEWSLPGLERLRIAGGRMSSAAHVKPSGVWIRQHLDEGSRRALMAGPVLSVFFILQWLLRWFLGEFSTGKFIAGVIAVILATGFALLSPFLIRHNQLERKRSFGRFVASRSGELIGEAERVRRIRSARRSNGLTE